MMNVLLESKASRARRRGGTAVSLAVHVSIIAAVAAATATRTSAREPVPRVETEIVYIAPARRAPTPSAESPAHHSPSTSALPSLATQVPPVNLDFRVTPTTIPTGALTAIDVPSTARGPGKDLVPDVYARGGAIDNGALGTAEVDRVAALIDPVRPRYPERLRSAGISGRVTVRFVIDTLGRVERDGIQALSSAHSEFTAAVRAALEKMRFRPAEAAGRRVRMLVEMPFEFALTDSR
jgi:periplasmic protein TonB